MSTTQNVRLVAYEGDTTGSLSCGGVGRKRVHKEALIKRVCNYHEFMGYSETVSILQDLAHNYRLCDRECAALIKTMGDLGLWLEAIRFLEAYHCKCTPSDFVYNAAIRACGRSYKWEEALQLLRVMQSRSLDPTIYTYTKVMIACSRSAQSLVLLEVFDEMCSKGLKPHLITYNQAISACAALGYSQQALQLLHCICEDGLEPDGASYRGVISSCHRSAKVKDMWKNALTTLEYMKARGFADLGAYCEVMSTCTKGGQWAKAIELFDELCEVGIEPNEVAVGAAINACARGKQGNRALGLVELISAHRVNLNVQSYTLLICACEASGLWPKSVELFSDMCDCGWEPNVVTYCSIITTHEKMDQWHEALQYTLTLLNTRLDHLYGASASYHDFLDLFRVSSRFFKALDLTIDQHVRAVAGTKASTWRSLVKGALENWLSLLWCCPNVLEAMNSDVDLDDPETCKLVDEIDIGIWLILRWHSLIPMLISEVRERLPQVAVNHMPRAAKLLGEKDDSHNQDSGLQDVDPTSVYFTHDEISSCFRNGISLDDSIESMLAGELSPEAFPPMDLVYVGDKLFSLSNRRLFIFRVLARQGVITEVTATIHAVSSPRITRLKWDRRLGRMSSKLERAWSTSCDGHCIRVHSRYVDQQ